jgi:serine/threonine protein kinase
MKKLGKFEIICKIGQGAMGVVYKARDPFIDRTVALKTLTTGLSEDPQHLKRFYSEARSAGGLRHPNIVTIYELGHEGDTPFIAMQFLSGESLDKIIDRMPNLPLSQKLGFIVYVCRALEYAHRQTPPVIHRDVKPGNVMVAPDGTVMVVDFGIARLGESTVSQSKGLLIGTLGYMSPQLFRGVTADTRSDIWATGVMFYELLAYRRPFKGENAAALMSNIILEEHRSIQEAAPGTPDDVKHILDRMLAKDAIDRYQTMEEVLAELEPVWKRYLQSDISVLLENSKRLYQDGDLMAAKSEIIQILAWDPTNTQAKRLADRISTDVRREQLSEQLKERIENAHRLLAEDRHEEAKSEAEAALKLDSSFVPAQEMLSQVREMLDQTREIDLAIETSRQKMGEGALTEAETQLEKAFAIDPDNALAQDQRKQLQQERANCERREHREAMLENARSLSANLQYDKCVELLLTARAQFPGDHEILQLLDAARRDQVRHKEKQDLLKQRVREVERMIDRQALTEAIDLARQTITTVGPEPRLSDILATAQREVEFREQKKHEQEQRLHMLRTLLADGRVDEASWAAKEALDTRLFVETDPRIAKLLEEIAGKRKSATSGGDSSGDSSGGLGVLGDIFPAGTKSDPGKGDPAKGYVYVRGVEPPKPSTTSIERNISAAAGISGSGITGSTAPVPATGSPSGSGISGVAGSGTGQGSSIAGVTSSAFAPGWLDREKPFLTAVEKQLAAHVGPIAGIVTSRAAAKASDPVELIMQLPSTLHVEADRKAFLSRKNELLRSLTRPVATSPHFDTQTMTRGEARTLGAKPAAPPVALTPAGIRHAGELLARYLGPVAKILAERAAPRATSEQALYATLAEHLQDPTERARFLRDAGFPQS